MASTDRRTPPPADGTAPLSMLATIRAALALVYSSGRRQLLLIFVSTIVTSAAIAGQLLVGRTLLDLLADSDRVERR